MRGWAALVGRGGGCLVLPLMHRWAMAPAKLLATVRLMLANSQWFLALILPKGPSLAGSCEKAGNHTLRPCERLREGVEGGS